MRIAACCSAWLAIESSRGMSPLRKVLQHAQASSNSVPWQQLTQCTAKPCLRRLWRPVEVAKGPRRSLHTDLGRPSGWPAQSEVEDAAARLGAILHCAQLLHQLYLILARLLRDGHPHVHLPAPPHKHKYQSLHIGICWAPAPMACLSCAQPTKGTLLKHPAPDVGRAGKPQNLQAWSHRHTSYCAATGGHVGQHNGCRGGHLRLPSSPGGRRGCCLRPGGARRAWP